MFTISIIAMIIGVVLIVLSQIIYHSKPIDAKEKMFIPGVCLFLVGLLSLIGHFVNGYVWSFFKAVKHNNISITKHSI